MHRVAAVGVGLIMLGGACSAGGGQAGGPGIPADVAGELATRADRVAAALGAGACDQALQEARSLQSDVTALTVDPAVKAEALAGAARLVNAITCVPPTTAAVEEPPGADSEPRKGKKHKGGDEDDD